MDYHHTLKARLLADALRMEILKTVATLQLPDCWVAAGFVRNLVWDSLHGITTPLHDVDVIYFDAEQTSSERDKALEVELNQLMPGIPWSVKNQARMHLRNGDQPYCSSVDAMSYWPEKETAVAARINQQGELELCAAFGLQCLFLKGITYNPKRGDLALFYQRINEKGWLQQWPQLSVDTAAQSRDGSD